jgi:hypothetical protein
MSPPLYPHSPVSLYLSLHLPTLSISLPTPSVYIPSTPLFSHLPPSALSPFLTLPLSLSPISLYLASPPCTPPTFSLSLSPISLYLTSSPCPSRPAFFLSTLPLLRAPPPAFSLSLLHLIMVEEGIVRG